MTKNQLRELRLQKIRQKIQSGLGQLDRGEGIAAETDHKQLKEKGAAVRRAKK